MHKKPYRTSLPLIMNFTCKLCTWVSNVIFEQYHTYCGTRVIYIWNTSSWFKIWCDPIISENFLTKSYWCEPQLNSKYLEASLYYTVYSMYVLYSIQYVLYSIQYVLYSIQYVVYSIQYVLYGTWWIQLAPNKYCYYCCIQNIGLTWAFVINMLVFGGCMAISVFSVTERRILTPPPKLSKYVLLPVCCYRGVWTPFSIAHNCILFGISHDLQ